MKRAAAIVAYIALQLALAVDQIGCGGGALGGASGAGPMSGIGGEIVSGSGMGGANAGTTGGGVVGSAGVGGDLDPAGRGGATGQGGVAGAGAGQGDAGAAGTVGIAGTGGQGGSLICPETVWPVCGGSLCGNGVVDTCASTGSPGCPSRPLTEECDGTNFGSDSCGARGFPSGSLLCKADCTMDVQCSPCVSAPSTLRCGAAPVMSLNATTFGLAATDSEVAYTMLTLSGSGVSTLSFARLSSTLDVASMTVVDDTSQPGPLYRTYPYMVAVAPLASGWVVAVCSHDLYIHRFDANGQDAGRTVVAPIADDDSCNSLVLAARPGGEVVLAWQTLAGAETTVIAADGGSITPPATIAEPDPLADDVLTAAWIGDAFYVGVPIHTRGVDGFTVEELHIVRVATGGQVGTFGDDFLGFRGAPSFAAMADDLRIVYMGITPSVGDDLGVIWQRIAPDNSEGTPVALGTSPSYFARSPAVAFGDDTVVLLGGGEAQALGLVRVAIDGTVVTAAHDILTGPRYSFRAWDMVRRGPDVIVGWLNWGTSQFLGLARVTP